MEEKTPNLGFDTVEMLAFGLKFIGQKTKKNILISAGKIENKEKILPALEKLSKLNVSLFATEGTSKFLSDKGIANKEIFKIAEQKEPNIKSFLDEDRFDLVINILTGNNDYDESSDSNLIRTLSIKNGIPLITDLDVAILTIEEIAQSHKGGIYKYPSSSKPEPWNLKKYFLSKVVELGGWANYHAHFDKAYLISLENLKLGQVDMQKKWSLYKYLKENYTQKDLIERISRGVEMMIDQGATFCRTMVDSDSIVKLLAIDAALEVKEKYKDKIKLEIGVQPLDGVVDKDVRKFFVKACEKADFVGGLPSRDRPMPEKHLDIILDIAKDLDKRLDVHVDQENNPAECETELLALKTIEHGMQGKVAGVHAISLSAKPEHEQDRIIKIVKDAGMSIICCPSAALSMKALKQQAPLHNSIAPVPKLIENGVPVFLGVDNVYDLFMPVVDGDMWFECRILMEACRYYNVDKIAEIACAKNWEYNDRS